MVVVGPSDGMVVGWLEGGEVGMELGPSDGMVVGAGHGFVLLVVHMRFTVPLRASDPVLPK